MSKSKKETNCEQKIQRKWPIDSGGVVFSVRVINSFHAINSDFNVTKTVSDNILSYDPSVILGSRR